LLGVKLFRRVQHEPLALGTIFGVVELKGTIWKRGSEVKWI